MSRNIAVVGLGYVGLPLALALAKKSHVIGFDISQRRINELSKNQDVTLEIFPEEFSGAKIEFTTDEAKLRHANFYIITVPTPVDDNNQPDLFCLYAASETVGKVLKSGDIVVYESTVYPGCTEEDCAPILEQFSGLKSGVDFKLGYSPERINPSDRIHTLERVMKIVSGQDQESLAIIADVYGSIVTAGLHKAESIKIAEAAKVLENTQRDVNISLMNELSKICDALKIDSNKVIDAAASKWNFMKVKPGLVGGHCIGVDPYYLISKAEKIGVPANLIKTAREINNSMSSYVVHKTLDKLQELCKKTEDCVIAVLGITFKENCSDIRNSRSLDIVKELQDKGCNLVIHDPYARNEDVLQAAKQNLTSWENIQNLDVVIINVAHDFYKELQAGDLLSKFKSKPLVMDVRSVMNEDECKKSGIMLWRL